LAGAPGSAGRKGYPGNNGLPGRNAKGNPGLETNAEFNFNHLFLYLMRMSTKKVLTTTNTIFHLWGPE
jgi:hypothetical protein